MSSSNDLKKTMPQNTIPKGQLSIILNNFIVNTTNHLNKLSINVDEKLSEFDKKMHDLEIMTTLFESKLESLPDEIKSTFPPLQPCNLDDVNPNFSYNEVNDNVKQEENKNENNENIQEENNENQEEEKKENEEEDNKELTPEEELNQFLQIHDEVADLYKMLKMGVPVIGVMQKATLNRYDLDVVNELIDKAKKVNTNIQ